MEFQNENLSSQDEISVTKIKERRSPLRDYTNVTHGKGGGGGGNSSSPKLLQPKASENPNLNKSETHINVKDDHDVVSPVRSDTVSKLPVPATSNHTKTARQTSENIQPHNLTLEGEEDEKFEDAEENKSNLTVLAEDLDKLHLSTPGRNILTSATSHEFVDTRQFRVNSLRLSDSDFLYESDYASDVSLSNTLNKSNYEVSPVLIKSSEHMSKSMEIKSLSEATKEVISVPMSSSVNLTESLSRENDFGIVNVCDISLSPNFAQPSELQKNNIIDLTTPKKNSKNISFQSPTDETTTTGLEKSYVDCKESSLSPFKREFKENFAKFDSTPEVHIYQTDDSMSLTSVEKDVVEIESVTVNSAFTMADVSPVTKNKVEKDEIINTSVEKFSLSSLGQVNLVKSNANQIIDDEIKITENSNANVNAEFNNSMCDISNTLTEAISNSETPKIINPLLNSGSQNNIETVLTTTLNDEVFSSTHLSNSLSSLELEDTVDVTVSDKLPDIGEKMKDFEQSENHQNTVEVIFSETLPTEFQSKDVTLLTELNRHEEGEIIGDCKELLEHVDVNAAELKVQSAYISSSDEISDRVIVPEKEIKYEDNGTESTVNINIFPTDSEPNHCETLQVLSFSQKTDISSSEEITGKIIVPVLSHAEEIQYEESVSKSTVNMASSSNFPEPNLGESLQASSFSQKKLEQETENSELFPEESIDVSTEESEAKLSSLSEVASTDKALFEVFKSGISSKSKDNYIEILGNESTNPSLPELICEGTNIHKKFDEDKIQRDTLKFSELSMNEVIEQQTNHDSVLFKCDMAGCLNGKDENLFQHLSYKEDKIYQSMEIHVDPADSIELTKSSLSVAIHSEADLAQKRLESVESGDNMLSGSASCTIEEKSKDNHLPSELIDEKEDCTKPNNSAVDNYLVTIPQSENIMISSEVKTVTVTTDEQLNLVPCEEELDFETKENYSVSTTILDEQIKNHRKPVDIDENSSLNDVPISSPKSLHMTDNKESLVKGIELNSISINFMEIPACVEQTLLENQIELSEVKNTNTDEEFYETSGKKDINPKTNETYPESTTIVEVRRQQIVIDKISTESAQKHLDIIHTKEFLPESVEPHLSNIKCTEVVGGIEAAEEVEIINHKPEKNTVNMNNSEQVTLPQGRVDCNILEIPENVNSVEIEFTEVNKVNSEISTKGLEEITSLHETNEPKSSCSFAPSKDFANTELKVEGDLKSQIMTEPEHNMYNHNLTKDSLSDEAQMDSVSIIKDRQNPVMTEHVLESENSSENIYTNSVQIEEASIVVEKNSEILDPDNIVTNTETDILKISSDSLNSTNNNVPASNSIEVKESGISVQEHISCSDDSLSKSFGCTSSNVTEAKLSFLNTKQSLEEMESKLYSEFTLTNLKVDQILSKHEPIESVASNLNSSSATKCEEKEYYKTPKSKSPESKTNKPKSPPKRSLIRDFKTCVTDQSNSRDDNIEFFVASDKIDVTFDERLAEEAANISEHILSLSHDLQDSDSDGENNRTVITLDEEKSKVVGQSSNVIVSAVPIPPLSHGISPRGDSNILETQQFVGINSTSVESYMQSMRSVHPTDLNQSEAGPITADELSTQDLEFQDGSNLDLDYFTRGSDIDTVVKSSLARDSLYVKFDPIVGAIVSKTVSDSFAMPPPPAPAQEGETNNREEQFESQPDEPKEDSLGPGQGEPQKTPGRSPALEAVQKLISLTPPSASSGTPVKIPSATPAKSERGSVGGMNTNTSTPRISQEHLQRELNKLEELLMSQDMLHKAELEKKDSEIKRLTTKMSEIEAGAKVMTERELRLRKEVQEKTKSRQQLSLVMEEYEKTISQLVAQKEEEKKESEVQKELLMKERDTAMQHLNNMEIAFNDVHQKYERSKTVIEGMKANEDLLKRSLAEYDEAIKTANSKYESLKNHAIRQLETANQELDLIRRSHQVEQAKLKAMLKKAEVRVTSLEESLEQKSKENQELAAICDELINKVGSGTN